MLERIIIIIIIIIIQIRFGTHVCLYKSNLQVVWFCRLVSKVYGVCCLSNFKNHVGVCLHSTWHGAWILW
jgi:hypothetical protein